MVIESEVWNVPPKSLKVVNYDPHCKYVHVSDNWYRMTARGTVKANTAEWGVSWGTATSIRWCNDTTK